MQRTRLWLLVELGALAGIVGLAWLLGRVATTAWLARVAELGVDGPSAEVVRGLSTRASLLFTGGVVVLAAGRVVAVRRGREPLIVPWLLPAALAASLVGLVIHHATVELAGGVAQVPTAAGFAQGVLLGGIAGAVVLAVPVDLVELASRARVGIAIAIGVIFLALAVLGSGPAGSGTRINLGPIQPIEIVKPLAIVFLAAYFGSRAAKLRWQRQKLLGLRWPRVELLVPALLALVGIFGALYVIGDLGPVLLLAFVFLGMFYLVSRATGWAVVAVALTVIVIVGLRLAPGLAGGGTVKTRLQMWSDPWSNALSNGHQLGEGLWATAAGGPTGQGLANAATPIVPAGKTDLILATTTEQLGWLGLLGYQLLLAALVFGCLRVAAGSRTAERTMIAGGVAILVLVQWAVIQAGTFGQLPLTGIVAPFLSAGRSSMVAFLAVVALVVRISADGPPREHTTELAELQAGVRGVGIVAAAIVALSIIAGLFAAVIGRHATSARGIVTRLADRTLIERQNPRLVAIAARIRRGSILDRKGEVLASSTPARNYPLGNAMGTLLGVHPARVLLPPWALERVFDHRLRGYPERAGRSLASPDFTQLAPLLALGKAERAAKIAAIDAAIATRSVTLSIDARLQTAIAKLLAATQGKKLAAAAVVIDADTGHVLARVQVPDYDPNAPQWQDRVLANDREFLRRFRGSYGEWPDKSGVHGMFQSGSVGKLFTAIAAVRANHAGDRYSCVDTDAQGPLFTRPRWTKPIHDHEKDRPHGTVDLVEGIAVSCNVYFGQLGLALGPEPFVALRRAGVEVGYSAAAFQPGGPDTRQLASTAFGQGVMVTSPLQAARLVAAIASGGHYRRCSPAMELAAPCTDIALVDDPAALAPVIAGMRRVMTGGTGGRLVAPDGVRVYGKTGTADVRGFVGEEPFGIRPGDSAPPHSWFVAFAEPSSAPEAPITPGRIVVAVVVPRGGTGASAAGPLAMKILAAAQELGYL